LKIELKQIEGLAFAAKGESGHWVPIDGPKDFGGFAAGPRPMELILMGLGGCTSMDILSILKKKRVKLDHYECHIEAERADEHPKVFTNIRINFIFYGKDISIEAVKRAIELSDEVYCSASAMLKKVVDIKIDFEIKEQSQ
jgi:putative redox protein